MEQADGRRPELGDADKAHTLGLLARVRQAGRRQRLVVAHEEWVAAEDVLGHVPAAKAVVHATHVARGDTARADSAGPAEVLLELGPGASVGRSEQHHHTCERAYALIATERHVLAKMIR